MLSTFCIYLVDKNSIDYFFVSYFTNEVHVELQIFRDTVPLCNGRTANISWDFSFLWNVAMQLFNSSHRETIPLKSHCKYFIFRSRDYSFNVAHKYRIFRQRDCSFNVALYTVYCIIRSLDCSFNVAL